MTDTPAKTKLPLLSFDEAFAQVQEQVAKRLSTSPLIVREYTRHLTFSQGKYIRAQSLLTCAMDSNDRIDADAVGFAAAIELLHLSTLVHDDVIDNAETRRGVVTLQKKYGRRTAVICGDYLLCIALQAASGYDHSKGYLDMEIPDYMSRICLGELNQHINNGNLGLSEFRYLKIIAGKTAALFEASFFGGAILSEKEKDIISKYKLLGHYLGMMFQLTDDCNDIEINKTKAKKPVQSDYEQGVITLPLIYTLKNKTGLFEKLQSGLLSQVEMNEAIFETGGLGYTHMIAKKYHQKSMKIVDSLSLTEEKRQRLVSMLHKACHWE